MSAFRITVDSFREKLKKGYHHPVVQYRVRHRRDVVFDAVDYGLNDVLYGNSNQTGRQR